MSRRIALVNPPSAPGTTANREGAGGLGNVYSTEGGFLYPPHALAVAAAALRREGHEVVARDFVVERSSAAEAIAWTRRQQVNACAVLVSWATWATDRPFLTDLRDVVAPTPVLAIGPSVPFIDGCPEGVTEVPGEPEWALLDLECAGLPPPERCHSEPQRRVSRIASRDSSAMRLPQNDNAGGTRAAREVGSSPAESWRPLDGLPMPAWDLFPNGRYGFLTVYSGKGCSRTCDYCPYVVAQGPFRARLVDEVVEEFRWLVREHRPRKVVFRDPVFAHSREVALKLCQGLSGLKARTSWECESRPECLDPELLREMQRAGCVTVKLGVESVDPRVLAGVGRIATEADAVDYRRRIEGIVQMCRRLGIGCRVYTLVGFPEEDDASIEATRSFVQKVRPDALHVKSVDRYPMNRLDEAVADEGTVDARRRRLEGALAGAPQAATGSRLGCLRRRLFR